MIEVINLCTSDIDMAETVDDSPVLPGDISIASTITAHRILDSNPRLTILPLYPIKDEHNHMKYPLLPNFARKPSE